MNIPKNNIDSILNAINKLLEYELPNDKKQSLIEMRGKITDYKKNLGHEIDDIFSKYGIEIIGYKRIRIPNTKDIPSFQADMKEFSQGVAHIDIEPLEINKITLDNQTIPIHDLYPLFGIIDFK